MALSEENYWGINMHFNLKIEALEKGILSSELVVCGVLKVFLAQYILWKVV